MKEDIIAFVKNEELPFCVGMCGISYCDGWYEMIRKKSDTNVIEYIISGCGTVCINGEKFFPKEGDIYFLKEGERHHYYSDSENPWVKIWMNFSGRLADKITECHNLKNSYIFHAPELLEYFERIYAIACENEGTKAVSEKCAVIFLELAQRLSEGQRNREVRSSDIAVRIKEYIDDTNDFSENLDGLAERFSYSKNHIIRAFKNRYGITPYDYMQNRRFFAAEELLKNTAYSISEIAERLSFCDVRYFSDCFKKRYEISPTQYRKSIINGKN